MSFDTLAPYYRVMEFVSAGGLLQRCRTAFLTEAAQCRHALLLGEGPGRFLTELLRTNPHVDVTCVDQSSRMLREARRRLRESEVARVRFMHADALQLGEPPALIRKCSGSKTPGSQRDAWHRVRRFDLVVTHFFLDCFRPEELAGLVSKIAAAATDRARWLLADFCLPEHGWQRWRARAALALMYAFFRQTTGLSASRLTMPDPFLQAAGFELAERRVANLGLVHSDLWLRTQA